MELQWCGDCFYPSSALLCFKLISPLRHCASEQSRRQGSLSARCHRQSRMPVAEHETARVSSQSLPPLHFQVFQSDVTWAMACSSESAAAEMKLAVAFHPGCNQDLGRPVAFSCKVQYSTTILSRVDRRVPSIYLTRGPCVSFFDNISRWVCSKIWTKKIHCANTVQYSKCLGRQSQFSAEPAKQLCLRRIPPIPK